MPSRVLETVLTGRNLLSPTLTKAAADVEGFDAKVTAASTRASAAADASSKAQATAADRVVAANTRTSASSEAMAAKVRASQAKASESTRAFADVTESSAARSAAAWSSFATKGLPLAAAAVAVVTGKMAADYQTNLVKLETTAGESARNIGMVGQGMLTMAGQVGVSAQDLSKAMYTVDSAGIHGADSLKVLKAAAEGARQENADLSKVTDAVTTALHDYHLPASQAAKVTSELVTAVSHGKTNFDELTGSLHSVTPLASKLGISLADVTGTLSAMTASGESADQATQNMADTLRHLANPTNTMIAELAQLGISTTDLSNSLSQRGLAGTLQYVSDAIVQHVDPATQKVLLPALNQSKAAAQDLQIMIGKMPPQLAAWSKALLDGTMTQKDFRKAALELGGTAGVMGDQFLSLYKSSDGFNQVLKAGGPAEQVFEAAMAKAIGTSAGLNVMLQTTGENAGATNAAIKDIASASAQADGNIKGWSEVQHTFNQQLHEAGAEAGAMAIQLGQHVLPAATAVTGWIAHDGLPGLEHLGSAVGGAVHEFMQLPAPVRDAALAMAGLKLADMLGLIDRLKSGGGALAGMFTNMGRSIQAGWFTVRAAYAEAKDEAVSSASLWVKEGETVSGATGRLRGLGAAAGAAAKGGLSALGRGLGGIVNLLGGPWVVGIGAAVGGIALITNAIKAHDQAVKTATADVKNWTIAEQLSMAGYGTTMSGPAGAANGGLQTPGSTAIAAMKHLADMRGELAKAQSYLDKLENGGQRAADSMHRMGTSGVVGGMQLSGAIEAARQRVSDLEKELGVGTAAAERQIASMTPLEQAQYRVDQATQDLTADRKKYGDTSVQVADDEERLREATNLYNGEQQKSNDLAKTAIQRIQDQNNALLGSIDAKRASQQASLQADDAITQYNKDLADGTLKGNALAESTNELVGQVEDAAKAAGDAAAKTAAQKGATDTAAASTLAMIDTLTKMSANMTGPAKQAIQDIINQLGGANNQSVITAAQFEAMGANVVQQWQGAAVEVANSTAAQIQNMQDLGYQVLHLPNGHIIVSADTNPAQDEINAMLIEYRSQVITLRSQMPDLASIQPNGRGSTSYRMGTAATGGPIIGPGTGTSDTAGLWALSNGEHVWTAAEVDAAGGHSGVMALRKAVLAAGRGRAGGGPVGLGPWTPPMTVGNETVSVHMDTSGVAHQLDALLAPLKAAAANSPYAGMVPGATSQAAVQLGARMAAAVGWLGPEFMALVKLWTRESGWNPYAVNPSSGAYGIPQSLGHGHPYNLGDSAAQIAWGLSYIRSRYGDPINAWAHETAVGWYRDGTNYVPSDQLAVLHRGEAVVPASENQGAPYRSPASYPGYGTPFSGATFGPTGPATVVEKHYHLTITNTGQPITGTKLMGSIRELEWLGGDT